MKSPTETVKGRIVGYDERAGELLIRAPYDDWLTMTRREYKECLVQPIDSRPLSDKQRRMCYALLREIAAYTGDSEQQTKELFKIKFLADELVETGETIFSLSNAPMSLVCAFQRYLIRFILDWDVPCSIPLLEYVDDIDDYVYGCMVNKKCCVCGKPAELHHVDRVGMGRNRDEIIHEGMEALPLCREHHNEIHRVGEGVFLPHYHLNGGVILDKTLCRIYGLKAKRRRQKDEAV